MNETGSSAKRTELAELLARHAHTEGRTPTAIEGLQIFRADDPSPVRCMIYEPCVIVVAQGSKRAELGGELFEYSPAKYLVLPVALPIDSSVVEATPEAPFLSLAVGVSPDVLGRLVLDAGSVEPLGSAVPRGIAVSDVDLPLLDACVRLVRSLDDETERRVLGPALLREVLYRVLVGPQGRLLRAAGAQEGRVRQVARALAVIHEEYARPIEVAELARAAHMSESTFYEAFRSVTSHSPLQYLKEIRLSRARQIMVWEGASARRAASRVGYGSASQFSREFKRRFGRPPGAERDWAIETGELLQAQTA